MANARIVCTISSTETEKRFPSLDRFITAGGKDALTALDLYGTIACIGIGLTTAKRCDPAVFFSEIIELIDNWKHGSPLLLAQYQEEVLQKFPEPKDALEPTGAWVFRKIGFLNASFEEKRIFGALLIKTMSGWE